MKDAVLIKSFQSGIVLHLKEEASIEEILEETERKFSEAKNFFGNANMVLSFQGKKLTEAQEILMLDKIKQSSDVNILCITGKNEETNKNFIKVRQSLERYLKKEESDEGQFYKGNLRNKEVIETNHSIVILGDVCQGSSIISSNNIIIVGRLYGKAYAGGSGRRNSYVAALEMAPEKLKIGDFKYIQRKNKQSSKSICTKIQPKIAYLKNGKITFEPITKDLLTSF